MKSNIKDSSGNVFADLNIENPEDALAKAEVAARIYKIIKKKKLTQSEAAKILKIKQPKLSMLLSGYLTSFSLERLFRFLNNLGQNVVISIKPSHGEHGYTRIGTKIAALSK
jgi:predicted XRE-type DNA-binding protein